MRLRPFFYAVVALRHTISATTSTASTTPISTQATVPPTPTVDPGQISPSVCNGHATLCNRKYSNITMVAAHNSPFDQAKSLSSNQNYGVVAQLNDGVRMLSGQTHMKNGTLHFCHTTCTLEDAGPVEDYFAKVTAWLISHPHEVVTLLLVNGDHNALSEFVLPLTSSGLSKHAYFPPVVPMLLDDWPSLAELIKSNQRAVIFIDFGAEPTTTPWILDEFHHIWETPSDPTDTSFPCTVQRPPGLSVADSSKRMYMANHNLNDNITLIGPTVQIPDLKHLNATNGLAGELSLGLAANNCAAVWGRYPNFLSVDYYEKGNPFNGSAFAVAAFANGVSYDASNCCGRDTIIGAATNVGGSSAISTSTAISTSSGAGGLHSEYMIRVLVFAAAILGT